MSLQLYEVVPTYNYILVQAHGRVLVHDDPAWVRGVVARLTRRFESARTPPWKMGDSPPAFLDAQLRQIVGLELRISQLEGKWKMSQNRVEADRQGMIAGLAGSDAQGDRQVAQVMLQLRDGAAGPAQA